MDFFEELASKARKDEGLRKKYSDSDELLKKMIKTLEKSLKASQEKYQIREGESAFEVLSKYIDDTYMASKQEEARSKKIHDMVEAMLPQVTDAQMQAYAAQKAAYDAHQKELKAQTNAITKAADAQVRAIDKGSRELTAALSRPLDAGTRLSKIGDKDTLVTQLFGGLKDTLLAKEAEDVAKRKEAIEAEKNAKLAAVKEEMDLKAKAAGIAEPTDPRKARAAQVAEIAKGASNLEGIESVSAAQLEGEIKKAQAHTAEPEMLDLTAETTPEAAPQEAAPSAAPSQQPVAQTQTQAPEAQEPPSAAPTEAPVAQAKTKGGAAGFFSIGNSPIVKTLGKLVDSVGGVGKALNIGMQLLADMDNALPVVSKGVTAISDASRLLGPMLFSTLMDLGATAMEGFHMVAEAMPFRDTRQERLAASGVLATARADQAAIEEQRKKEAEGRAAASTASLTMETASVTAKPARVQSVYTTPVDERKAREAASTSAASSTGTDEIANAVKEMADAQTQAAKRQAQLGQGAVPLMLSNPSLEAFAV